MTIFDDASVLVAVADHVGIDAAGKANVLGLGFTVTGIQQTGLTASMYVLAFVDAPSKYAGDTIALTFELRNLTDDEVVKAPGATGVEAVRITQQATFEKPMMSGVAFGPDMLVRVQALLGFTNGLPLAPGKTYAWKLKIDERSRPSWRAFFHVPAPPPAPIIGGPAGPADIPNIAPVAIDIPEDEDER
jgi:hypothetical protein